MTGERFEGTCDACGDTLVFNHDGRSIDYDCDDDGRMWTWVRHIDGPEPMCNIYSSRVYKVYSDGTVSP